MYEYDQHGRLSSLVQPTGQRMSVSTDIEPSAGAIARLSTDSNNGGLSVATNGNVLSVLHGKWLFVSHTHSHFNANFMTFLYYFYKLCASGF